MKLHCIGSRKYEIPSKYTFWGLHTVYTDLIYAGEYKGRIVTGNSYMEVIEKLLGSKVCLRKLT